jgi:hypothetical protein
MARGQSDSASLRTFLYSDTISMLDMMSDTDTIGITYEPRLCALGLLGYCILVKEGYGYRIDLPSPTSRNIVNSAYLTAFDQASLRQVEKKMKEAAKVKCKNSAAPHYYWKWNNKLVLDFCESAGMEEFLISLFCRR